VRVRGWVRVRARASAKVKVRMRARARARARARESWTVRLALPRLGVSPQL
jgi:hypothetical protein